VDSEDARTLATAGPRITLVLGGARSGKSEVAEQLAASLPPPVAYLATAVIDPSRPDAEFAARVEAHRRRRPASWRTVEAGPGLIEVLDGIGGSVIVDGLGTWVAGIPGFAADAAGLCAVLRARPAPAVLVSDEVGLGVHPGSQAGRHFRDALGQVNRAVADVADRVLLVVAGRVLALEPAAVTLARGEG
jgi:adenosylcobinamide kinase / adenosylcobinamide-phosphate guanylyltransferase